MAGNGWTAANGANATGGRFSQSSETRSTPVGRRCEDVAQPGRTVSEQCEEASTLSILGMPMGMC